MNKAESVGVANISKKNRLHNGAKYSNFESRQNGAHRQHQKSARKNRHGNNDFFEVATGFTNGNSSALPQHKVASPTKIISTEDALGAPCTSLSFDDYFRLDSDMDINDYSPISKGAPICLDNRVSPL